MAVHMAKTTAVLRGLGLLMGPGPEGVENQQSNAT